MSSRAATALSAGAGLLLIGLTAGSLAAGTRDHNPATVFWAVAASWAVFGCAMPLLREVPARLALRLVVGVGVALQVVAALWLPRTSSDVYRYAWDGHVSNSGIDPYAHPPSAPQLDGIRLSWLFPPGQPPLINRPDATTIYPPVSQLWFRLIDALTPDSWGIRPFQVAAALVAVLGTLLLVRILRLAGRDPRWVALWAWCPLIVLESGNNAHVDGLAAVLTVAAIALVVRRRHLLGGLVLGAAIGVKLIPGIVVPSLLRRRPWVVLPAAAGLVALAYVPHVVSVGRSVIGYLPAYLGEEGYDNGDRFALLHRVMPQSWTPFVAVAIALVTAVLVHLRGDRELPWVGAVTLVGVALLISTPTYPWYALLLVGLAVAAARPEWLVVCAAGYLPYLGGWTGWSGGVLQQLGYGTALVVVLVVTVRRRRSGAEQPAAEPGAHEGAGHGLRRVAPGR